MKMFIVAALVLATTLAHAGRMKDIYTGTVDSIVAVLGLSEDIISIESQRFVTPEGSDFPNSEITVEARVRNKYTGDVYYCTTRFAQVKNRYLPVSADCK